MNSKVLACIAFLFNAILFGTYYAVSKEAIGRIDPIIFTFFEMMTLMPAAVCIMVCSRRQISSKVLKRGLLLGSSLCLALFTLAIALKYTTATGTAFFPSLNGFLAAFIAWIVLRHPIAKATWLAGLISVIGTALLIVTTSMGGPRGSLIAFLGGLFFTGYVFLADHEQKDEHAPWALFGIELLTMALWANLIVLLFGDWGSFHPQFPKDVWVILYVATACTFLPTMLTLLMQKYLSPVTVSFLYILEPVFGVIVALFYLHEVLPLDAYLGGGFIVVGAIIHTWGSVGASEQLGHAVPTQTRRPSSLDAQAIPAHIVDTCLFPVEATATTLGQHSQSRVIVLPQQSQLFSESEHFPPLQQACAVLPVMISFVLPLERMSQVGRFAHEQDFPLIWSRANVEEAFLHDQQQRSSPRIGNLMRKEITNMYQNNDHLPASNEAQAEPSALPYNQQNIGVIEQQQYPTHGQESLTGNTLSPQESISRVYHHPETPLPETFVPPTQTSRLARRGQLLLLILAITLLVVLVGAVLLPSLFTQPNMSFVLPPQLTGAPPAETSTLGKLVFSSSGQLDPKSATGLNDIVTLELAGITPPQKGMVYSAWLESDRTLHTISPLLLGKLQVAGGKTQLTYQDQQHTNLLSNYSRLLVTLGDERTPPTTMPLDTKSWRYQAAVPDRPTPGDESGYSLLSHLRHLLAKDPALQQRGLQGGLDIWLYRNLGKILEWSNAARDDWAGNNPGLLRRLVDRVIQHLDGQAFAFRDLPAGTPWLVDPGAGRMGLIDFSHDQATNNQGPPSYISHVRLHLNGLVNAPGHTHDQQELAIRIDDALGKIDAQLKDIRKDAVQVGRMNNDQLEQIQTLTLLNEMQTKANAAYIGSTDPATGAVLAGDVWVHDEIQSLATMPITLATANGP